MAETNHKGVISFIHHDKGWATIEYVLNEKKKTVNFKLGGASPAVAVEKGKSKPVHPFRTGDHVSFQVQLAEKGDRMVASQVRFLYNHELEKIIQKAKIENIFKGFLKMVDDTLYVKELSSYLFFPLILSKWEKAPPEKLFNEAFDFVLVDTDKPDKMKAVLYRNEFIPEYKSAMNLFQKKTAVEAIVYKVSPYALYLNLINDKVQGKMAMPAEKIKSVKVGDRLRVLIKYLSPSKLVLEPFTAAAANQQ